MSIVSCLHTFKRQNYQFQAIQFSQIVLIQTIHFIISTAFAYTQLHVKTVLFQTIQFSIQKTVPFQTIQFNISSQLSSI